MFKNVIVGISGGIDSAVASLLLKNKGFNVTGIFMKNWDIVNEIGECQAEKDYEDAEWICKKLKIPLLQVNFVKEYWNEVFSYLIESYQTGETPNPDIQCNKKIKFDKFFHFARHDLKADAIATGHYARNNFGPYLEHFKENTNARLLEAKDPTKDQTFFLSQIPQESLKRCMFPLGDYFKKDVRKMALEAGLDHIVHKKESMGICFIGSRNFQNFICEYVENKPGDFIDLDTGVTVGKHNGIHYWTLGQGIRLSGCVLPYFVFSKDVKENNILVVKGTHHPALFTELVVTAEPHWIDTEPQKLQNENLLHCNFRFQHRKSYIPCVVFKTENKLIIQLDKPCRAITGGQYAVLYLKEQCLGSAKILQSGPSYFNLNKNVEMKSDESEQVIISVI